jgi:hypothetical protein
LGHYASNGVSLHPLRTLRDLVEIRELNFQLFRLVYVPPFNALPLQLAVTRSAFRRVLLRDEPLRIRKLLTAYNAPEVFRSIDLQHPLSF